MARPEGEQSPNPYGVDPNRQRNDHGFLKSVFIAAAVALGGSLVLQPIADKIIGKEEEVPVPSVTPTSTSEGNPTPDLGIDSLTNCPADAKLTEPGPGDEVWPDLLLISFPGKTVPAELQKIVDDRNLCFFTYVPVNDEDPFHLLWLEDHSKLHEVKAQLDPLVESGVIASVDFEGVSRALESTQPTE